MVTCVFMFNAAVLLLLLPAACVSQLCPCNGTATWDALVALYRSTNGNEWLRQDRWMSEGSSICDWFGVRCSAITLPGNRLSGTLPKELAAWSSLTVLDVSSNSIIGTLPPEYSAWTELQTCNVSVNGITGTLPPDYSTWVALVNFAASWNCIGGSVPPAYAAWRQLSALDLGNNTLTGTLSSTFGEAADGDNLVAWSLIRVFLIHDNHITGALPASYGNWSNLANFRAGGNRLMGTLPESFSLLKHLIQLDLDNNSLSGTLPSSYAAWGPVITMFSVSHNRFVGTIPGVYSNWSSLVYFHAKHNNLSGTLPPELSSFGANLKNFIVSNNSFTGTLPAVYSAWRNVSYFVVGDNAFSGTLPASYARWLVIESFNVERNLLTGTLPAEYAAWGSCIYYFVARSNSLTGSLPVEYVSWTSIRQFVLDNNSLTGTLPSAYGAAWASSLSWLAVSSNFFTSTLPPEYSAFRALDLFAAQKNQLTGTIPPVYRLWPVVTALILDNNLLSGTLPPLGTVLVLTLHNNIHLRGTIPATMGYSSVVTLCNTSLCGALPQSWLMYPGTDLATMYACSDFSISVLVSFVSLHEGRSMVVPVDTKLPLCTAAPVPTPWPPEARNATAAPSETSVLLTAAEAAAGAVMAVSAALSVLQVGSVGTVGMLHVSIGGRRIAERVRQCKTSAQQASGDDAPGALFTDNPTRMALPGAFPLSRGAVVGNTLLVCCSPVAVPAVMWALQGVYRRKNRDSWERCARRGAAVFVEMSGLLQVPTAAAAALLICCAADNGLGSAAFGAAGLCSSALSFVAAVAGYFCMRPFGGATCQPPSVPRRSEKTILRSARSLWSLMWHKWSSWDRLAKFPSPGASGSRTKAPAPPKAQFLLLRMLLDYSLKGYRYPYVGVLLLDLGAGLAAGLLGGIAAYPALSCVGVLAASWALFSLCTVQAAVHIVARPRPTTGECVFSVLMSVWTAVAVLLAALGDEAVDAVGVAQGCVQLVWCAPLSLHRFRSHDTGVTSPRRNPSAQSVAGVKRLQDLKPALTEISTQSSEQNNVLKKLVAEICERQFSARCAALRVGRFMMQSDKLQASENLRQ